LGSALTEQADDRLWRMLPSRVYVARGYLPPGEHSISINGQNLNVKVQVDGQYALVPLRFYENSTLLGDIGKFGKLPTVAIAPPPEPTPAKATTIVKPAAKAPVKPAVKKPAAASN
jgi:hypothetical protein